MSAPLEQPATLPAEQVVEQITAALRSGRFTWSNEYDLQAGIEAAFSRAGLDVERERRIDARSRLDFFVAGCVAVEVKTQGTVAALVRQVGRYAQDPRVKAVVVASSNPRHRQVPAQVLGVPVRVVVLGGLR